MKLRREELFRTASGPPGILPPGTKSWHLGMSRPGAEAVARRGVEAEIVRSGAGTILNNIEGVDGD